jgi:hypothetical protein
MHRQVYVVLTSLVFCAGSAAARPPTAEAVQHLRQTAPGAQLHADQDRPTRVYGVPLSAGRSPELSAAAFVQAHSDLFGRASGDLVPGNTFNGLHAQPVMYEPETGAYKFTLVYYAQYASGLPVYRAELRLLVRNTNAYPVVWVGSSLRDLGRFVVPAGAGHSVAEGAAQAAAAREVPGLANFTPAELTVWAGIDRLMVNPAVALTFEGDNEPAATGDYQKWRFIADAESGQVLYKEDLVLHTDVTGTVRGMATQTLPPKADVCNPENLIALKYARVSIGATTVFTDAEGNYTIPNSGSDPVTVTSPIAGRWFEVQNQAGASTVLTQTVTPPGPADFMHNQANTAEFNRAEVNGYVEANVVRDWVLSFNPLYPTIYNQLSFPVKVNIDDSCNAFYNGQAINFFRARGGCSNTAYSGVVHHEYGHHLVSTAGSGQGQFGEGQSDVTAMLIADDPILGYGFFSYNCNIGIRSAINDVMYPCEGEVHDCGMLLSGCVWETRNALAANYPDTYLEILTPLAINAVLLHDGNLITPAITIDYLALDDDDGNIYNGTPHYDEICTGFGSHGMDCPVLQAGLEVTPADNAEFWGNPGGPFGQAGAVYTLKNIGSSAIDYQVTSDQNWLTIDNSSGVLDGGAQTTCTLALNASGELLPQGNYSAEISFVNTTTHFGDTARAAQLYVGGQHPVYTWNLDSDPGWTTTGQWAWGTPSGQGGQTGSPDPSGGYTGSQVYGYALNGDYADNAPEYDLTTLPLDCRNQLQVKLRFRRWLGVERRVFDHADVRVSADGQNWTSIWQNPDHEIADDAWLFQELELAGIADNQPTVYLRWGLGPTDASWHYCGWNIDDVQVWAVRAVRPGDLNCDGAVNFDDINAFVLAIGDAAGYEAQFPSCNRMNADCNVDGLVNFDDINAFVALLSGQ